jgi:hypothetical protein
MTPQEILQGNKLIAEFMGFEIIDRPYGNGFVTLSETEICDVDDLLYHRDWNWLMPVVEKIDVLGAKVTMTRMLCDIKYRDPLNAENVFEIGIACGVKINAVYGAVIEFINLYNKIKIN